MNKDIPEFEITSTPVVAQSKKLKTKWTMKPSDWMLWVNFINEPDEGQVPGTFKLNMKTKEAYGVHPENPGDPGEQWRWTGYYTDIDGNITELTYEEAYDKIFDDIEPCGWEVLK